MHRTAKRQGDYFVPQAIARKGGQCKASAVTLVTMSTQMAFELGRSVARVSIVECSLKRTGHT